MKRLRELLRFDGRLSRLGFWRNYLTLAIALTVTWGIALFVMMHFGGLAAVLLLPMPFILVSLIAISIRRLHDRGKTGWWVAPFVILPEIVALDVHAETAGASPRVFLALLSLATIMLGLWGWVEIGFRRGTRGTNRFGDEPAVGD
jgi:uncharacterized membrane protein YhaH (DUF805 family)